MSDLISRKAAIDEIARWIGYLDDDMVGRIQFGLKRLPSAELDNRLAKIADLVEGTIDHFDLDDAMDLLYQIKDVLK